MQFHTQAGSITTNIEVKIYFTLPDISAMKIMMWDSHVDDYAKGRYNMILDIDLLTALWLYLKYYDQVIEVYYGPFEGSMVPMVDLGTNEFKDLNTGKITPE